MRTKILQFAKKYPAQLITAGGAAILAPLMYSSYKKTKRYNILAKKHKLDPGQDLKSKAELRRFTKLHKEFYDL